MQAKIKRKIFDQHQPGSPFGKIKTFEYFDFVSLHINRYEI